MSNIQYRKIKYNLPVEYSKLPPWEKKQVREQYREQQSHRCYYCHGSLEIDPPEEIRRKRIDWSRFPKGFLHNPIHLHHSHDTGLTLGAVHAYCNAVLWQYHGE